MITAWQRLDNRPRHLKLTEWDRKAEVPEEVRARYANEIGPPLLLWSTGELSGGLQGERWMAWPCADYPRGVIRGHQGKGCSTKLWARSRHAETLRLEYRSIALIGCDSFDPVVLDWLTEHRSWFAPLFPEGIAVEPTTEDYG